MTISFQNFIDKYKVSEATSISQNFESIGKKSSFVLIQQNLFYSCCLSAQAHFYEPKCNIKVFDVF